MGYRKIRDRFERLAHRHVLLKSFSKLRGWFIVGVCHRWKAHTHTHTPTQNLYVHQPEAVDRRKQTISDSAGDFNSGRSAVWHGFRSAVNIVQFSVMSPGVKRSHAAPAAAVVRLRTGTTLRFCLLSPFSSPLRLWRCSMTASNFVPFVCNRRGCYLIEHRCDRSRLSVRNFSIINSPIRNTIVTIFFIDVG